MRHQRIPCMPHVLHICKIQLYFYIFVIHFCKTHILDTEDNERGDAVDATARHTLCCIATPKARDSMHSDRDPMHPDWDPKKAQIRHGAGGYPECGWRRHPASPAATGPASAERKPGHTKPLCSGQRGGIPVCSREKSVDRISLENQHLQRSQPDTHRLAGFHRIRGQGITLGRRQPVCSGGTGWQLKHSSGIEAEDLLCCRRVTQSHDGLAG